MLGSAAAFAPLVADTSLWFVKRRGIAVAVCASGNYMAGAVWPPIVQHFVELVGWRQTYFGLGIFCGLTMAALALLMRPRPPDMQLDAPASRRRAAAPDARPFGLSLGTAQGLLCIRAWRAASPWRCRKSTSWPTAAISASAPRAARRCSR